MLPSAVVEFKREAVYWSSTVPWVGNGPVNRECLLLLVVIRMKKAFVTNMIVMVILKKLSVKGVALI